MHAWPEDGKASQSKIRFKMLSRKLQTSQSGTSLRRKRNRGAGGRFYSSREIECSRIWSEAKIPAIAINSAERSPTSIHS